MFQEVKQSRAFEDIVTQIEEAILQGELKNGDRLPSERKLREVFNVSRGTLREALRALEQRKLIRIKTGVKGGAEVREVDTQQFRESLDRLLRYQKVTYKELAEFREAVEGIVVEKAVKKANKQNLEEMDSFLGSIKNHLDSGEFRWAEVMEEDIKFHLYLAQIAGNRIFESILYTIYGNISRYYNRLLPRDVLILESTYEDLSKIANAFKKRDPGRASAIIRKHVGRFNRIVRRKGQQEVTITSGNKNDLLPIKVFNNRSEMRQKV